jgi:O-antigen ligase/polysaccharide polymerase Wzy-like membrane protein
LGAQVGQDARTFPLLIIAGSVGTLVYLAWFRTVRFEALILSFLLFGYIVGNRGFAQLTIRPNSPLYIGEVGMLACLFLVAARRALTREKLVPRTPLSLAIVALLLLGAVRLFFDTVLIDNSRNLTTVIRDSAAVYYAIFFFIAYQIGKNEGARSFVERTALAGFLLLIPIAAMEIWASNLLDRFTIRQYPIIQHKGDLLAAFLAIGSCYFFLKKSQGVAKIFFRLCSITSLILMLFPMSRSAITGFILATVLLLFAKRRDFAFFQIGFALIALVTLTFLEVAGVHFESELFGKLSDRVASIVDISGKGDYRSSVGDMSVANNQFRAVWWKTVITDTMDKSPWFGLGFGYDLSASFLREYYLNTQTLWDTRSPHSIWITMFGRLGIFGAAVFTAIIFLILRSAFAAARGVAKRRAEPESLFRWCAVIILLCSALLGVVMEGPMGGILFWSFLGLAVSQQIEGDRAEPVRSPVREKEVRELPEPSLAAGRRAIS